MNGDKIIAMEIKTEELVDLEEDDGFQHSHLLKYVRVLSSGRLKDLDYAKYGFWFALGEAEFVVANTRVAVVVLDVDFLELGKVVDDD